MKKSLKKWLVSAVCLSMTLNGIPMMAFAEEKAGVWSWDVNQIFEMTEHIASISNEQNNEENTYKESLHNEESISASYFSEGQAGIWSWNIDQLYEAMDTITGISEEETSEPNVFYSEPDNEETSEKNLENDIVASGVCGETVKWTLSSDGTLTISGSGPMDDGTVCVDYLEQIKSVIIEEGVTSIGAYAFMMYTNLTDVQIPSTVDTIKTFAFCQCESLESIYIPATVTSIDYGVFPMCTSLKTIDVEEGNPLVCSIDGVMYSTDMVYLVTWPAGKNENVVVADGVKFILPMAFSGCGMSEVTLPEGLDIIATQAFLYCGNLENICIPASVTMVEPATFAECHSLKSIDVEKENPLFSSTNGALFYKGEDGIKFLVEWPAGNSDIVDIPADVDQIVDYGLCCCKMTEVVIPEKVSGMGGAVFYLCPNLTSVEFTGDCPEMIDGTFNSITATCYYPANNATWTEDKLQNYGGTLTWVAKEVEKELTIISQPDDFTGKIGDIAQFTIEAEGNGLTYQWQYCNKGSNTWRNSSMTGADTNRIEAQVTEGRIGQKYRCVIADNRGNSIISDEAQILLAEPEIKIVSQPTDYAGFIGTMATFRVEAVGESLTYQWQYCNKGSNTWRNSSMAGSNTELIETKITEARIGQKYRCVITDSNDNVVITDEAQILLAEPDVKIVSQPVDYTGSVGVTAIFTVEAEGEELTYQWQYCNEGSNTWRNSSMKGADTNRIEAKITETRIGQKYRCVITAGSGYTVTTDEAQILLAEPDVTIISQPADYAGSVGGTAIFTVEAEGEELTYQWQYCNKGSNTWRNSSMKGADTNRIEAKITEGRIGQKYRCVITSGGGYTVTTDEAEILLAESQIEIISQPSDYSGNVGDVATFSVEAVGEGLTYQWQYRTASGNAWRNSGMEGATTPNLIVQVTKARNGQSYRCIITDTNGNTLTSEAAALTVK